MWLVIYKFTIFFHAQKGTQVSSSATRPPCLKMKKYQQLTYSLLHCMSEMDTPHSSDRLLQVFYLKQVNSEKEQDLPELQGLVTSFTQLDWQKGWHCRDWLRYYEDLDLVTV